MCGALAYGRGTLDAVWDWGPFVFTFDFSFVHDETFEVVKNVKRDTNSSLVTCCALPAHEILWDIPAECHVTLQDAQVQKAIDGDDSDNYVLPLVPS